MALRGRGLRGILPLSDIKVEKWDLARTSAIVGWKNVQGDSKSSVWRFKLKGGQCPVFSDTKCRLMARTVGEGCNPSLTCGHTVPGSPAAQEQLSV